MSYLGKSNSQRKGHGSCFKSATPEELLTGARLVAQATGNAHSHAKRSKLQTFSLLWLLSKEKQPINSVKENRGAQQIVTNQQEKTNEKRSHSSINQLGEKWLNDDTDC